MHIVNYTMHILQLRNKHRQLHNAHASTQLYNEHYAVVPCTNCDCTMRIVNYRIHIQQLHNEHRQLHNAYAIMQLQNAHRAIEECT